MMKLVTLDEIKAVLPSIDLLTAIEAGFVAYSEDRCIVPPVGELLMDGGEVHIKYGSLTDDPFYVIKIASGFSGNPKLGLPSSNGLMLLFSQQTGELVCILLDEGHLTDVRTAVAGAISAKYLAPRPVRRIGIMGTGIQAQLQLKHLQTVVDCREVLAWGRGVEQLGRFRRGLEGCGFSIETTLDSAEIGATCNLIVTTTSATEPILGRRDIRPGTHITAIGSDTPHKQELDVGILADADQVVADSKMQCRLRGEIFKALEAGVITQDSVVELGHLIGGRAQGRTTASQVTVFDSTGVAVQDIKIANAVYDAIN
ncbi:MAG: ornithine cyclodeaminase family protein [Gammaproteobacteria bacterium]|nr:MAG: ornithine cyclodeaminase family protein [Gammaproteobacteria bacterium]